MTTYNQSLFIFRRDLRLADNTGLMKAMRESVQVVPIFIFDPRQVESNAYKSLAAVQFMLDSLNDLDRQITQKGGQFSLFYGNPAKVVEQLVTKHRIEAVFVNKDYTPFSQKRDDAVENICRKTNVDFHQLDDLLLNTPQAALKKDGSPYTVFTPFYNNARKTPVDLPVHIRRFNLLNRNIGSQLDTLVKNIDSTSTQNILVSGGRNSALKILRSLKKFDKYASQRNIPALSGTTLLSAHHKFGTCSIREVYYAIAKKLGEDHPLIRELYWRDFFTHIGYHFPHVFGNAFKQKYDSIPWETDSRKFNAWKNGNTGFPIVDAGMRQLNQTGFMHNRVRMITASFLVKNLLVDWRKGEKYFARHLVDYDPAVNNGNWQWAASTGCDAQPYFRIFNPWLQQQKFDRDCQYIYQWIPELKNHPPVTIHKLFKQTVSGYPAPIVDHKLSANRTKEIFRKYASSS